MKIGWIIVLLFLILLLVGAAFGNHDTEIKDKAYDLGWESGYDEGYNYGYEHGYEHGLSLGQETGYDEGWYDSSLSREALYNLSYAEVFDYLWGDIGLEEICYYIADYTGNTVVLFDETESEIDKAYFGSFASTPIESELSRGINEQNFRIVLSAFMSYLDEHELPLDSRSKLYPLNPDEVYWSTSGLCFHSSLDCPALENVVYPFSGTLSDAFSKGKRAPCSKCVG